MLRVTNRNNFDFKDRYNGVDYDIPAGATTILNDDAARHFFGIGDGDKTPFLIRQGWMKTLNDKDEAFQKLNGFSFSSAEAPMPGEIVQQAESVDHLADAGKMIEEAIASEMAPEPDAPDVPDTVKVVSDIPVPTSKKKSILDQLSGNA